MNKDKDFVHLVCTGGYPTEELNFLNAFYNKLLRLLTGIQHEDMLLNFELP